jgi:hypothetical protein
MTTADHGGFDIAIEIAEDTITLAARSTVMPQMESRALNVRGLQGRINPRVTISDAELLMPNILHLELDLRGTNIEVTQITFPPGVPRTVPPEMGRIVLDGTTVSIDDHLEIFNNALVVNYTEDTVGGTPVIHVILDEPAVVDSPLVRFILAHALMQDPTGATYRQIRTEIVDTITTQITTAVRDQIIALGRHILIPAPPFPGLTETDFKMGDRAIHLLYRLCGLGGTSILLTRTNLLRRTSDGQPLDVAALIASNVGALSCFIRPRIAPALGLTPTGFNSGHPFSWSGRVPLPIPVGALPTGISGAFVTSVLAGIDGTNLRLLAEVDVDGVANAFRVRAAIDTTFSLTATVMGGRTITLTIAPLGSPSVRSDVSIAGWVYVAGFLTGGAVLAGALAAIDAFGGLAANGVIASIIMGFLSGLPPLTLPFTLPPSAPRAAVRAQSLGQRDAPTRTITTPTGRTITDPFRVNDIIINFV